MVHQPLKKFPKRFLPRLKSLRALIPQFLEMVNEEAGRLDAARETRLRDMAKEIVRVRNQIGNLMKFICEGDSSDYVRAVTRPPGSRGEKTLSRKR